MQRRHRSAGAAVLLTLLAAASTLLSLGTCAAAAAAVAAAPSSPGAARPPAAAAATQSVEQQWRAFWASELPAGIRSLQDVMGHVNWLARYQKPSSKAKEPPNTAGLDLAIADSLQALGQHTKLGETQAWVKEQVTQQVLALIDSLQHPTDCATARKLVCMINSDCGFGCQIHHAVRCLSNAVALNRTLILKTEPWQYSPDQDGQETWEQLMAPVSSCSTKDLKRQSRWPKIGEGNWLEEEQEVFLLSAADLDATSLDPPSMPADVMQAVQLFNFRPEIWWIGVLASYLLRPSVQSAARHAEVRRSWGSPTVGVHIRRSDKVSLGRAHLHLIDEYLAHVECYCDWRLGPDWQRQQREDPSGRACTVYLASDEPAVLSELHEYYPHIHVVANPVGLETGGVDTRYSLEGLRSIYDDLILLASADYNVGTLTSQIGRLTYELSQVHGSSSSSHVDASLDFYSLDVMWFYEGMKAYELCVTKGFNADDGLLVRAGQHLLCRCPVVVTKGQIKCQLLNNGVGGRATYAPPGSLGVCKSSQRTSYRNVLPSYMREDADVGRLPAHLATE